ncbi:YciI family protein [Micromonosporaceae bacterium Da 78-11]
MDTMRKYLLSVYQPDGDPPPPEVLEPIMAGLAALNDELRATGAWVFAAGLFPASTATVIRDRDGEPLLTDGPFTEGKEHLGGFTVIGAADLDAALAWGARMAAVLAPLAVEVRPIA